MEAVSFSSVTPPPISHTRANLVASAHPRRTPQSAAEKNASALINTQKPQLGGPTMTAFLKQESAPRPAPYSNHDPVAIIDQKLQLDLKV